MTDLGLGWFRRSSQPQFITGRRNAGRNGSYLLWLKLRGIVVDIKDFHYGHRCGGRALSIHVCGLDGQFVLGDFLGEKGAQKESSVRGCLPDNKKVPGGAGRRRSCFSIPWLAPHPLPGKAGEGAGLEPHLPAALLWKPQHWPTLGCST